MEYGKGCAKDSILNKFGLFELLRNNFINFQEDYDN